MVSQDFGKAGIKIYSITGSKLGELTIADWKIERFADHRTKLSPGPMKNRFDYLVGDIIGRNNESSVILWKSVDAAGFLDRIKDNFPEDFDFFIWHPEIFNGEYHD